MNRPAILIFSGLVTCYTCSVMFVNAHENHADGHKHHTSDQDTHGDIHTHNPSNCNVSLECNKCSIGRYKRINIGTKYVKVCCPNCSQYFQAGNKMVDNENVPYCSCYSPDDIKGDCWKGAECKVCQQGPYNEYVGYINSIPVCCKHCEKSGLALGLKLCECLHNGP